MKRSDFLYVMSLGRGGSAAGACLDNRWYVHHGWSDAARAASLAVRRSKAAARGATEEAAEASASTSASSSPSSSGGEGGEKADDGRTSSRAGVSAINVAPNGRTYVGFTDNSVEPPRNHYLPVGGEADGWKVVSADYDSEEVVLEKDGKRITVNLGGDPRDQRSEAGDQRTEVGDQRSEETEDAGGEGFDLGDAWEDFQESGIWSMGDTHREGILEDIRERYEQEGDAALEHGERKFLELYEKWESVQSMAGMIVEGGGGEPPPFAETQARLRETVDDPAATDEERNEAQLVYRAEMEAARRIWEAKAGQAFYTKYGRSADTEAEALEGEQLAGVPYEYAGSLADGYLENRRRCKRRRRELANRIETEALARLANVGWTDEARAASLLARRLRAGVRGEAGGGGRKSVAGLPGGAAPDPASIRAPSPPGEGTIVNVGGGICVMTNGKLVRIGSTKVLCVLPDGQLGVKLGGRAYPVGKPPTSRAMPVSPLLVIKGGTYYLDVGKGYLSLETGQLQVKPYRNVSGSGGAVRNEIGPYYPFMGRGVEIPPDPPDISQRWYLQS